MQGGDLYKPKPRKAKKIASESPKRKKEHVYYSVGCKELEAEVRAENDGKIYDFFTGLEIKGQVTWHHLLGRSGSYYTDKQYLVPAENDENEGHLFYHGATIEELAEKPWYKGFLMRLKSVCPQAFYKELKKQDKGRLFIDLDLDN